MFQRTGQHGVRITEIGRFRSAIPSAQLLESTHACRLMYVFIHIRVPTGRNTDSESLCQLCCENLCQREFVSFALWELLLTRVCINYTVSTSVSESLYQLCCGNLRRREFVSAVLWKPPLGGVCISCAVGTSVSESLY